MDLNTKNITVQQGDYLPSGDGFVRVLPRPSLAQCVIEMEKILRKHDHKKLWVDYPIEALMRHMRIELEEFQVALEFHTVAEARHEILDVMNYMFFLWDRLGIEPQDKNYVKAEKTKEGIK